MFLIFCFLPRLLGTESQKSVAACSLVLTPWRNHPVEKVKSALQYVVLAPWRNRPVEKVKSALQYVVLAPWSSDPVGIGTFHNPIKVSSDLPVFRFCF